MSADFTPEKEDYKILTPFKMQVLTNFPYIEADFDALTNYQLLCKVVEYLNGVIHNENEVTEQITSLYNAYVSLQGYVNNYFDNLDVQEEINNKLDEMAENDELIDILNDYVVPYVNMLSNQPTLFIGDSYTNAAQSYAVYYKQYVGLPNNYYFKYAKGGAGWYSTGTGGKTYIDLLNDAINDMTSDQKQIIKNIIVGCGINDANYSSSESNIKNGIVSFMTLVNANFPNANVYVINCGNKLGKESSDRNVRQRMENIVIPTCMNCNNSLTKQILPINNSHLWLKNKNYFNEDNLHPNDLGQQIIAKHLIKALLGSTDVEYMDNITLTITKDGNNDETLTLPIQIYNNSLTIRLDGNNRLYNVTDLTKIDYNEIGTWECDLLQLSTTRIMDINVICRCYLNSSTDYYIQATLRLGNDGKIYLFPYIANDINNIVNFTLYSFNHYDSMLLK